MLNLDGLANGEVYPFVARNDLNGYLETRHVRYLLDFPAMLQTDFLAERSGLSHSPLLSRLHPLQVFKTEQPDAVWNDFTLWSVD